MLIASLGAASPRRNYQKGEGTPESQTATCHYISTTEQVQRKDRRWLFFIILNIEILIILKIELYESILTIELWDHSKNRLCSEMYNKVQVLLLNPSLSYNKIHIVWDQFLRNIQNGSSQVAMFCRPWLVNVLNIWLCQSIYASQCARILYFIDRFPCCSESVWIKLIMFEIVLK